MKGGYKETGDPPWWGQGRKDKRHSMEKTWHEGQVTFHIGEMPGRTGYPPWNREDRRRENPLWRTQHSGGRGPRFEAAGYGGQETFYGGNRAECQVTLHGADRVGGQGILHSGRRAEWIGTCPPQR